MSNMDNRAGKLNWNVDPRHDKEDGLLREVERKNTECLKWDALDQRFGDPDLIAMWVADMDFAAPQPVLDALHERVAHGAFGYHVASDGWRNAFIDWEQTRHECRIEPEWLRYTPGIVPAVYWLVNLLTEPGDACLIQTPVYYPFHHAVRDTGRTLVCSDLQNNGGIYSIDFERFERDIVENGVRLFILCSPHNPVGRVWTRDELSTMLHICAKHKVFVLSDEIHQDIILGERRHIPTALVAEDTSRLITLNSASKTFNLASLENATLVIPDPDVRAKYDQFIGTYNPGGGNVLGFVAVEAAYRHGASWLEALLDVLRQNEAFIREAFAKELPEVILSPLEGTYLLWADLRGLLSEDQIKEFMLKECGVAVDYGVWFGDAGKGFIRLNLATPGWRVEKVARRIIEAGKKVRASM